MLECRHGYSSSENVFAISGNFGFGVGPEQQQDFPSANAERLARGRRVRGAGKELVINYLTICVRRVASCPSVQSHRFARRSRFCSSDQCPILARSPVAHGRGLERLAHRDDASPADVAGRARAWIGTRSSRISSPVIRRAILTVHGGVKAGHIGGGPFPKRDSEEAAGDVCGGDLCSGSTVCFH